MRGILAIKDILLHLDAGAAADAATDFAVSLAAAAGAHLTAAGVVVEHLPPATDAGGFPPGPDFAALAVHAQLFARRRQALQQAYDRLTASVPAHVHAELAMIQTIRELARDEFGRLARHFDLSVVSQGDDATRDDARLAISGALFGSGRPLFVVPAAYSGPARLDTAMLCWDGGVQSARALAAALPLLTCAARVDVVCVGLDEEPAGEPPGSHIARHLARHGVNVRLRNLAAAADAGAVLLAYAAETAVDFLVMGGYGHWRLAELILGGTTRTVLAQTTTPIFIAH